jgi:methyltransferase (TIGR00027 family)
VAAVVVFGSVARAVELPSTVSYVPMDFTKDDLLTQLTKAGYSQREKTFFLWEGVVFYLPEAAVKDTLHFVRDHAAPGSRRLQLHVVRN